MCIFLQFLIVGLFNDHEQLSALKCRSMLFSVTTVAKFLNMTFVYILTYL